MPTAYDLSEFGFSILILLCISNVLDFYSIYLEDYSIYIAFYGFLLMSKHVLPSRIENIR